MVWAAGIEPAVSTFQASRITTFPRPVKGVGCGRSAVVALLSMHKLLAPHAGERKGLEGGDGLGYSLQMSRQGYPPSDSRLPGFSW